jgi:NAD(P)-dependent dehydrogenase (short-subunit alcohol dehydrogenase family)
MARILITGSSDGLGSLAAKKLVERGHQVVLHGRNEQRAQDASTACPGGVSTVTGDLSSLQETKKLADDINKLGTFDCIIHNAGLYRGSFRKTPEGIPALVAVNTIAPYVLASLITRPKRMVFLSSEMHQSGSGNLDDVLYAKRGERGYNDGSAYCDSKLHNVMFAKALARRWPDVRVSSMDPGWVATKMGGSMAPGSADKAVETYVMLAEGEEKGGNGSYYRPGRQEDRSKATADDEKKQDRLLEICAEFSGVNLQ